MTKTEKLLERKIFLKQQHIQIIRREVKDLKSELKRLGIGKNVNRKVKA